MIRVRDARETDLDAISEGHVASVRGVDATAYTPTELAVWEAGVASVSYPIGEHGIEFLVAERKSEIVGFAQASVDEQELDKLYVVPAYQRQGVATALIREIETQFQSHGVRSVYVESSLNAAPFYERVGYERMGTHQKAITVDGTSVEMTLVDMEKTL